MGRPASDRAVAEVRRRRPDLDDLPDAAVATLTVAHVVECHLAVADLGRVVRSKLPGRLRRALGARA